MEKNKNFTTLPKQEFPALLKKLLEKDYSDAICSGFQTCGLYPLCLEKALAKLPQDEREVESDMQRQLLKQLSSMRYNQPTTTHANRPKKKEKLPPGASYTCVGMRGEVGLPVDDTDEEMQAGVCHTWYLNQMYSRYRTALHTIPVPYLPRYCTKT
jgi:hypothetical protein